MRTKRRGKKRKVPRCAWIGVGVFLAFLVFGISYQRILQPEDNSLYTQCITLCGIVFAILVAIFAMSGKKGALFGENVAAFFRFTPCVIVLAIMLGCLGMIIYCDAANLADRSDPNKNPSQAPSAGFEEPAVQVPPEESDAPVAVSKDPYLSLNAWEEDPFFKNIDQYYGYHVEEGDIPDSVRRLICNSLPAIGRRGRYPADLLNGQDSEYAKWTREANDYYEGYQFFSVRKLLPRYQEMLLQDEIQARKNADGLYQVSDNEKIISDRYINLGDFYKNSDTKLAFECYAEAFKLFQVAFRTCIAEGGDLATLELLSRRITNVADKMAGLEGMDSREQVMAPLVAEAFQKAVELKAF